MRKLSSDELSALQQKIIEEGWMPTEEHFSLHVYESRWEIDDIKYILYKVIGYEQVEGYILANGGDH